MFGKFQLILTWLVTDVSSQEVHNPRDVGETILCFEVLILSAAQVEVSWAPGGLVPPAASPSNVLECIPQQI